MFTFSVMSSEVVAGVDHFSPKHGSVVPHLHVGLHLGRLQGVDMDLEVGVVERLQVSLNI